MLFRSGTLLGAGGLVRSYGDAVRSALAAAGTRPRELMAHWRVELDHAEAGRVEGELRNRGAEIVEVAYGARVSLHLAAPVGSDDRWRSALAELTAGRVEPVRTGEGWVDR